MAKAKYTSNMLKSTIYLSLLVITIGCARSARILNQVDPQSLVLANEPEASDPTEIDDHEVAPMVDPATTLPSGQIPATATTVPVVDVAPLPGPAIPLPSGTGTVIPPSVTVAPITTPTVPLQSGPGVVIPPSALASPVASIATTLQSGPVATTTSSTTATSANTEPPLAFFMHDILGGSRPSGRVVTGLIANSQANGLPFSKTNSQVFPINDRVPLNTINNIVSNNNVPFLAGLNGSPTSTAVQNNGNNNVLPFVSIGQLPAGITLQQLMVGTITVVDNELIEGHELGSSVLGKGQGFYLSISLDGSSHTLALTTLFHGGDHDHVDDTISFFGVHRTASPESQIAVIGGTGKYENAKGHATIETIHVGDQHTTDGVETVSIDG